MKEKRLFFVLIILAFALLLSACSNYAMDSIINGKFVAAKAIIFPKTIPNQVIPLNLLAQIYPLNASNKDIMWNVLSENAEITDTRLTNLPAVNSKIKLRAVILNGLAKGKNLVQDIVITVRQGGTETNPWLVHDNDTLKSVDSSFDWSNSAFYRQIADIDITETEWAPIGSSGGFCGVYKGNGYTISNLKINDPSADPRGLFETVNGSSNFGIIDGVNLINCAIINSSINRVGGIAGQLTNNGKITNCSVKGTINGDQSIGGIVGNCDSGAITNCSFSGNINGGNMYVGGIAGENKGGGQITNCGSSATIAGGYAVGGIVGYNLNSTVDNCHSNGIVKGIGVAQHIGGIAGTNQGDIFVLDFAIVRNCYSTANVGGDNYVGGIVGTNNSFASPTDMLATTVTNCYSGGTVTGQGDVGGIVGENYCTTEKSYSTGNIFGTNDNVGGIVGINRSPGTVKNCYATGNITGSTVGGIVGNNASADCTITNCYAIGNITGTGTGTGNTGGISGDDFSASGSGILTNCVALSKTLTSLQPYQYHITGGNNSTGEKNYFRYDMKGSFDPSVTDTSKAVYVTLEEKPDNKPYIHDKDGFWGKPDLWNTNAPWDFTSTWDWNSETELPILRNMPGGAQNPAIRN